MIETYLEPGHKIEMRHMPQHPLKDGQKPKVHISQIFDVLEENKIEVLMPIERAKLVLLPLGAVYTLVIYTQQGVYQCEAKVVEQYKKGKAYLLAMEMVSPITKYQRREYYRHNCTLPIFTRTLTESELEKRIWDVSVEGTEGLMLDLGGGGVRFISREEYQPENMILCCFQLPIGLSGEMEEYRIVGKVLSSMLTGQDRDRYEIRVQFEDVTNSTREEIIQFIFEDERRQKKGRRR